MPAKSQKTEEAEKCTKKYTINVVSKFYAHIMIGDEIMANQSFDPFQYIIINDMVRNMSLPVL